MTLLIANVVPQGLIFAADRNLSVNGTTVAEETKVVKVGDVAAGYAGRARVAVHNHRGRERAEARSCISRFLPVQSSCVLFTASATRR